MLSLPFIIFWLLLFLCRNELGLGGVVVCIAVWGALLLGITHSNAEPRLFIAGQAILDSVLILILFGQDIRIR